MPMVEKGARKIRKSPKFKGVRSGLCGCIYNTNRMWAKIALGAFGDPGIDHQILSHKRRGDSPRPPQIIGEYHVNPGLIQKGRPKALPEGIRKTIKFQYRFLIDFWIQNDPKIDPQSHQKSIQKPVQDPMSFFDRFLIKL